MEIPARNRQSKQKCRFLGAEAPHNDMQVRRCVGTAEAMPLPVFAPRGKVVLQPETTSRRRAAWVTGARSRARAFSWRGPLRLRSGQVRATTACSMSSVPLRVALGLDNFTIAHVNDAIAIGGGFGIVGNHENRLSEFLVGVAQHVQHNL